MGRVLGHLSALIGRGTVIVEDVEGMGRGGEVAVGTAKFLCAYVKKFTRKRETDTETTDRGEISKAQNVWL